MRRRTLSAVGLGLLASLCSASTPLLGQDLVLTNANVVDVTSGTVREGVSVLVEGNRIAGIVDGEATAPSGARTSLM